MTLDAHPDAPERDPVAAVCLAVAGMLVVGSGVLWLAGHLAVLAAGRGHAPFTGSSRFLIGMINRHGVEDAWRAAYPDAPAPNTVLFWTIAGTLAALLSFAGCVGLMCWQKHGFRSNSTPARWARRHERTLVVSRQPADRRWRTVARKGCATRRLLAGQDCVSAVVFGPNGSGKTTALIVPNVLDWDGPAVVITSKPQDLEPICTARKATGPVWVVAPGGAPGHQVSGWSPVQAATDAEAADPLHTRGEHVGAAEYASTLAIHEEGKGSVLFTAIDLADTHSRPGVLAAADTADLDIHRLLDEHGTLCLVTPSGEGDRFAPYFTALVTAVVHAAETRSANSGAPLTPRLLLALDEAGNVFCYPQLTHVLTTSRGNGIQLLLVYHGLAQVEHLYGGRQVARTNAKLRLLLPGVGDLDTLRYWSDLLGRTRTQTRGETQSAGGQRSRSRTEHVDDLAPLHVRQQLPHGQAVLVHENLPPTRVNLLPWSHNRRYRHLRPCAAGSRP